MSNFFVFVCYDELRKFTRMSYEICEQIAGVDRKKDGIQNALILFFYSLKSILIFHFFAVFFKSPEFNAGCSHVIKTLSSEVTAFSDLSDLWMTLTSVFDSSFYRKADCSQLCAGAVLIQENELGENIPLRILAENYCRENCF